MSKCKVKVVTGYVPLPSHPRKAQEYYDLGQQLGHSVGETPIQVYYEKVADLWLTKWLESLPPLEPKLMHNMGDNPDKNTLEYHCVQHQKFEWLWRAARQDNDADTFVWIDYGITRLPGFTADNIRDFLKRIRKNDWAIPGCWELNDSRVQTTLKTDIWPCWRFCGGLMVVPRGDINRFFDTIKRVVRVFVKSTHRVEWEVNTLARAEPFLTAKGGALRQYMADHDGTMLTRY